MSNLNFRFLAHASRRASQRGISIEMIKVAISLGEVYFRQGLRYFICLEKHLRGSIPASRIEKFRNTVVIMNDGNEIVTCYKNKNAARNIRRKSKWLSIHNY